MFIWAKGLVQVDIKLIIRTSYYLEKMLRKLNKMGSTKNLNASEHTALYLGNRNVLKY